MSRTARAVVAVLGAGAAMAMVAMAMLATGASGRETPGRTAATGAVLGLVNAARVSAARVRATGVLRQPLGDVSHRVAFSDQRRRAGGVQRVGRRDAMIGALALAQEGDLRLRAGGSGILTISLQRQVDRPARVTDTRVEVALPGQYRAGAVRAPGWRCSRRGARLTCDTGRGIGAGALSPIAIGLRARGAGWAAIAADASWRQGGRRYASDDRARFRVRRPIALRAASVARTVLSPASGMRAAPIVLTARLGHPPAGMPVQYRWRQLCGRGSCPRVRWVTPTAGRASGAVITAQVGVPAVSRPTRLRFAVTARSWRGTTTASTAVTVRPQATLLARSSRRIRTRGLPRTHSSGYTTGHAVTRGLAITGSGLQGPRVRRLATLRASAQGGRLSAPRWSELRGPRRLLAGRQLRRPVLVFRTPRRPGTVVLRVRAVVSGTPVTRTATVHVVPAPRHPRRRTAAVSADADTGGFCALWSAAAAGDPSAGTAAAPIPLADDTTVLLGNASASGPDCDAPDAAVSFTTGSLVAGAARFTSVAGSVTANGLRLRSGWLERPAGWSDLLPQRILVEPGRSGAWGADLTDSTWGPLRARIDLDDGVELLPLPAGWTFPIHQTTFTYEPTSGTFALHSVARAPADQRGEVTLDGSYSARGSTTVSVEADDVAALHGVGTDTVALSGDGTVTATPTPDGARLTGSVRLSTERGAPIPLVHGVLLSNATANWTTNGIALAGDVVVQTRHEPFEAAVAGTFQSSSQWRLEVTQAGAAAITDGITLRHVHGLIERAPGGGDTDQPAAGPGHDEEDADTLSVDLAGSIDGWSPSPQLTDVHVGGQLTNRCPKPPDGCQTSVVRLAMSVSGRAHVLGQTVAWEGAASIDLSTLKVRFSAGARVGSFGPSALSLSDLQLRLTNQGAQWCRVAGGSARGGSAGERQTRGRSDTGASASAGGSAGGETLGSDQDLSFSVTGRGRILGQPFTAMAELTSSGYCLAGTFGDFDPAGLPSGGDHRSLIDDARLLYATRDAEVSLAGRTVAVKADQLRLTGQLNFARGQLPARLRDLLGGHNELALTIARSDGAFTLDGTATFTFARPVYLIGDAEHADEAQLRVNSAQLAFAFGSSSGLRLGLVARSSLLTPANAAKGIAASTTPLFVAAGVDLGTPSVTLSAGVDSDDPALVHGTVTNAFGQPGLDVRKLVVAASLGAGTSFGISADATLPTSWTRSLGMEEGVPARVAFSISQTAPCLDVAVGMPPPADGGTAQAPTILRLGALSANYAQIVVAPTGCTIGAAPSAPQTKIEPGFGLGFDGQIGAAPVTFLAAMRLDQNAFAINTHVRIGAFDAGSVHFRRTQLDLDIDTAAANRHIDVGFSGGLDVGESNIDVDGRFTATADTVAASLKGRGRLRLAGVTFAEGTIDSALRFQRRDGTWKAQAADVQAQTTVLGTTVGLIFSYRDGNVATAAAAWELHAGAGPAALHGGVLFAYAPDGVGLTGGGCNVGQLSDHGEHQLLLRLCGGITLGPLRRDLNLTIALPHRFDFDLTIPRTEVGVYLASVYFEGSLHASLQLGLTAPRFWVRDGHARAGGCVNMLFWRKCADGINVAFNPSTGRFEGHFLTIPVSWGSDEWRSAPAPAPDEPQPPVGLNDRVFVQSVGHVALDHRTAVGDAWQRTAYEPGRGLTVPASAVFDPDRHEISVLAPVPAGARGSIPRPSLGYLLTFSGIEFHGDQPRATTDPGDGQTIAYRSVSIARVPSGNDRSANVIVERGGTLTMATDGLSLNWNANPSAAAPSRAETTLAHDTPQLAQEGLPLGATIRFPSRERTVESRQALLRRTD